MKIHKEGWTDIQFSDFRVNDKGWTNPETGEYFPPNFGFYSQLTATRLKDSKPFYVMVRLDRDGVVGQEAFTVLNYLRSAIQNALASLDFYSEKEQCTPLELSRKT